MQKKICLLGMFGVGKSSLVKRFVDNLFEEKYHSTIGVKVDHKKVVVNLHAKPQTVELLLWDIASQDDTQKMVQNYFRAAHGALVVYDLTRPETAERLARYCEKFREISPQAQIVFAANKADLVDGAKIELARFAEQIGQDAAPHFVTSAKTGENVEQAFQTLAQAIMAQHG